LRSQNVERDEETVLVACGREQKKAQTLVVWGAGNY
jgi:hypothetical protein